DRETGKPLSFIVNNTGTLKAKGGTVELTAATARGIVNSVVNTSGTIEANSVRHGKDGQITLSADTVEVSGKLSAAGKREGTTGGKIVLSGRNIRVSDARINASGVDGGGRVIIAARQYGDQWNGESDGRVHERLGASVHIDKGTRISVSSRNGDGGK